MDKKIKKIIRSTEKLEHQEKELLKMDKKNDKKIALAKTLMKKKK